VPLIVALDAANDQTGDQSSRATLIEVPARGDRIHSNSRTLVAVYSPPRVKRIIEKLERKRDGRWKSRAIMKLVNLT
jgi:hypothetical protein